MRSVLLASLLVACGFQATELPAGPDAAGRPGDPVTGDADSIVDAVPMTPQQFLEQLIRIECEHAFVCKPQYTKSNPSFDDAWGTDLDDCIVTDDDFVARDQVAAAVTANRITWSPVQAAACLAAPGIPTDCLTLFEDRYDFATACYAALVGHTADGGACTTDWECSIGSVCRGTTCGR